MIELSSNKKLKTKKKLKLKKKKKNKVEVKEPLQARFGGGLVTLETHEG
jgi:hypothetical protein